MRILKISILYLILFSTTIFAQFSLSNGTLLTSGSNSALPGLDTIFVVANFNNVRVSYTHTDSTDFSWSSYNIAGNIITTPQLIPSTISSNIQTSEISINGPGGYEVEIGPMGSSIKKYIWLIDYESIEPQIDSLKIYDSAKQFADSCSHIILQSFVSADSVRAADFVNNKISKLNREQSIAWSSVPKLNFSDNSLRVHLYEPNIPYEDTKFTAKIQETFFDNGSEFISEISDTLNYLPVAVKIEDIVATIIERDNNNELDKIMLGEVKGSAPLNVNFSTKGTNSKVDFFDWEIVAMAENDSQKLSFAIDSFRYECRKDVNDTDIPDYTARVTVSNDYCQANASKDIKIVSSFLDAANIFVIGFGNNSEASPQFKVVYKSIKLETFQGAIYNRWGRRVFTWSDPQLGWDGRYNGRYVSPGVYYYVIMAEGTDGEKWKVRRDLNIIIEQGLK